MLRGSAPGAVRGIEGDFALLAREQSAASIWECREPAVVLGISREPSLEVDDDECARRGIALLRRASGGGTVVIGPGTLQYAIVLRHPDADPPSIDAVKRRCSDLVRSALAGSGIDAVLDADPSGDLALGGRKVGGVALRRHRNATLLHGTLLLEADLGLVAALLRHPASEPAWRRGRRHADFLANLGAVDRGAFARALRQSLRDADERGNDATP